jgi:FMN reductase
LVRIVGISGSLRDDSVTRQLVRNMLNACQDQGATVEMVDLRRHKGLPFCDGRKPHQYPLNVRRLQRKLGNADAFIIGTPEYHGGYSGVLKNFLDLMDGKAFKGKLVGFVGASGGEWGAEGAMNQLRVVFKNLGALCFPHQTSATKRDLNAQGRLANDVLLQRIERLGGQFVRLAKTLKAGKNKVNLEDKNP